MLPRHHSLNVCRHKLGVCEASRRDDERSAMELFAERVHDRRIRLQLLRIVWNPSNRRLGGCMTVRRLNGGCRVVQRARFFLDTFSFARKETLFRVYEDLFEGNMPLHVVFSFYCL
ncbi:hypothetical protein O6H91_01G107300 [Diphasiastrum complanatum]|uniref:Uncharacterized protein n=1 Tax=Diphasiastrum complanatum TaxID=34168 RepID=A0ACC2EUT2_DIPCM|nr:hypothetical protein O6H91_Y115700 [Diphasiastrum complanatum]KAJ7570125.1 hypothetical protein O6H91_01G107300 [Diphasiastrum complanatum]